MYEFGFHDGISRKPEENFMIKTDMVKCISSENKSAGKMKNGWEEGRLFLSLQ